MKLRELLHRESDGISVSLFWNPDSQWNLDLEPLEVHVKDSRNGADFIIRADDVDTAKDAFYHPFGVANRALKSGKLVGDLVGV